MTFKQTWEKTEVSLPADIIEQMVNQKFLSYEILSGGCGNLNVRIDLEKPFILRIYLRDPEAAYREQALGNLLKEKLPVPLTHHVGDCGGYRFAMMEFLPGITLRDALLSGQNVGHIMYDVGQVLTEISAYRFKNLNTPSLSCAQFIKTSLKHKTIPQHFFHQIQKCMEKYEDLLPPEENETLVHGDFDPSNILVSKIDDKWTISGVIDWEFSFSGSYLWDVANMLRDAHKMPPEFEHLFLQGLQLDLPLHWKKTTHMLNIASLLDLLIRSDVQNHPNRYKDICELMQFHLDQFMPIS